MMMLYINLVCNVEGKVITSKRERKKKSELRWRWINEARLGRICTGGRNVVSLISTRNYLGSDYIVLKVIVIVNVSTSSELPRSGPPQTEVVIRFGPGLSLLQTLELRVFKN